MKKQLKVLFWIGDLNDPSPRFRFLQFIKPLREKGVNIDIVFSYPSRNYKTKINQSPFNKIEIAFIVLVRLIHITWIALTKAKKYDLIYTNKDLMPNLDITIAERILSFFNPKLIFDIDDAIYLSKRGKKLDVIWQSYIAVIAGSPVHIDYIKSKHNLKCFYIPMAIDTHKYQPQKTRKEGKIRIGWSGSHFTNIYALPVMKQCMEMLAEKLDFELIVISNVNPKIEWKNVQSRFIQWTEETEVEGLQQIDIGLMPLKDEPFERGKCALKAVQYMAVGIPALVSPVGVNTSIVTDGFDGYHCRNNEEFVNRLLELVSDKSKKIEMGKNARKTVEGKYSVEVLTERYIEVFNEIASF
jgi:glycosyltransferase involved in cell wall biosynthesis